MNQGFLLVKLKPSLQQFYARHHDLVDLYGISVSQMPTCHKHFPVLSSFMTYHQVCNQINTINATSGDGTAYTSGAPVFSEVRVTQSLVLLCMFCRSLFVLLPIVLSVHRFTGFDYPFDIFKLFLLAKQHCLSLFFVVVIQIQLMFIVVVLVMKMYHIK